MGAENFLRDANGDPYADAVIYEAPQSYEYSALSVEIAQSSLRFGGEPQFIGLDTLTGISVTEGTELADNLVLTGGNDTFSMGDGSDIVDGGEGNDIIYGNKENDTISGGEGADIIFLGQNDGPATAHPDLGTVKQRAGTEFGFGGAGADTVYGNFGNDELNGGADADFLFGGQDDDTLIGGTGDDSLFGNRDDDLMSGGAGSDQFLWHGLTGGNDTVSDFSFGVDSFHVGGGLSDSDLNWSFTNESIRLSYVSDGFEVSASYIHLEDATTGEQRTDLTSSDFDAFRLGVAFSF